MAARAPIRSTIRTRWAMRRMAGGIEGLPDGTPSRGGEAEGDTLTGNIEHVIATDRNDTIHGGAAGDGIAGRCRRR